MKKPKLKQPKRGSWMARQKPGYLTGPVSGRQALKEIKANQRLEFGPLERTIQGDLAGSAQRQRDIPGWFQQYQNTLTNSASQTKAAYDAAQQQLSDRMNQAGALDQANRADMQQRAAADAQLRGVATPQQGAQDSANIAASRQNLQAGYGGTIATLGANQAGYLADKKRIGAGEQINQLLKEQTRQRGIRSDLRELAAKEGDFATKYLADLRESERKYALGRATLKGENKRALISAQTSRSNNKRTTSTSAANNIRTTGTSAANNKRTTSTSAQNKVRGGRQQKQHDKRTAQAQKQHDKRTSKGKGGKK